MDFCFFFLYCNSYRGELNGESQPGGPRCSGGLLSSDVGSLSQWRLRHDSPSAQNGLRHIFVADLCVFDPEDRRECCGSKGDRVQLLPLNADTHAERQTHTRTITI